MWGLVTSTCVQDRTQVGIPRFPPRTYKDPITRALLSRRPRKSRYPGSRNTSQRLAPFFDAIVPVMMATAFSVDKRFLCEITTEDLRLYNLISVGLVP
ncbi:hypothetical protein KRP22_011464 [Phytophthora ramorum]|nr:hypothetical protein KRP22_10667 [Phytophthora ramorum]